MDPAGLGGRRNRQTGHLCRALPAFAGNDKEVFEFLQGLSWTDKQTLWRTARWYNYLVDLTLEE